jgi:hypothetical protein
VLKAVPGCKSSQTCPQNEPQEMRQNMRTSYIWLVVSTPLKNMKVSWDDYSQYMEKKNVPNHQPVMYDMSKPVQTKKN